MVPRATGADPYDGWPAWFAALHRSHSRIRNAKRWVGERVGRTGKSSQPSESREVGSPSTECCDAKPRGEVTPSHHADAPRSNAACEGCLEPAAWLRSRSLIA